MIDVLIDEGLNDRGVKLMEVLKEIGLRFAWLNELEHPEVGGRAN